MDCTAHRPSSAGDNASTRRPAVSLGEQPRHSTIFVGKPDIGEEFEAHQVAILKEFSWIARSRVHRITALPVGLHRIFCLPRGLTLLLDGFVAAG